MVNIIRTRRHSVGGSPRAEVGEIDTKAPFQSVRAAVSLFGEASSPKAKPHIVKKPKSQTEGVLDKETQFHLALNELNKLKELFRGAESTKAETLPQLDKAKTTLAELKNKLETINESKQSILEAAEALKSKARKLQEAKSTKTEVINDSGTHDNDSKKKEYKAAIAELDAAKQELNNMRRDFDAASETKFAAFRQSEEAQLAADAHRDRLNELTKQVAAMQEALAEIKASSKAAEQEHEKLVAEKEAELQSRKLAKEDMEQRLVALKKDNEALLSDNLDVKLAETEAQIRLLQEELRIARDAFLEAQRRTSVELETAKQTLNQAEGEKATLQNSVESLKQELEHVGKELSEQKRKGEEAEALVKRLQAELEDKKNELETGLVNKTSAADASDDMVSTLEQLAVETARAKQEVEEMNKGTEELKHEAKTAREMAMKMENKLSNHLMKEIEEAKSSDRAAKEEIKAVSERADAAKAQASSSDSSSGKIKLAKEEYNSLTEKANESEKLAEVKVADAVAHVEALIASQKEAAKKIEAVFKEIEQLKTEEEEAMKSAEMAEAAAKVLEAELHRRRQQEEMNGTAQPN